MSVNESVEQKLASSVGYREAYERMAPFEQIARIAIMRRAQLGLSQQQVAERMGTTMSVISRIESGRHRTGTDTLRRLAKALDGHALVGFEFGTDRAPERELVAL
jgi:transcriptional regulator with XRE-family HTH domain